MAALVILCLAAALAASCGFHLRGHAPLPATVETLNLQLARPNGELGRALRPLLQAGGVTLVSGETPAAARLVILESRMRRRILTVGRQARVSEYLLQLTAAFKLIGPDGRTLVPVRRLEVRQDYTFNEGVVLGKQRESAILREELYERMARLIVLRINTAMHDQASG